MARPAAKANILILGSNFAGLGVAQKLRAYAGEGASITVIDRKSYLLFIPNISGDVFADRDPVLHERMDVVDILAEDGIAFIHGEVQELDIEAKRVTFRPAERPGAERETCRYDYLVIALGNRLAFDRIEGFAEHGHSVTDLYHGQALRRYLDEDYRGGPIAIGSARFTQGDGANGLAPYPGGSIPLTEAACEGPPIEIMLSMATWLKVHGKGGPDKITVFTPAKVIAEDAGMQVVKALLGIASEMGFHYLNETEDIRRLSREGVEFASGQSVEAELKIVLPDWIPHGFLKGLPISDNQGFIKTDLLMRNPDHPEIFAVGDAAAVTVPKLGAIGHQECDIAARQIAYDLGRIGAEQANTPLQPVVYCIGDMGGDRAFYIRSNSWFGGDTQVLKMGFVPYLLKMQYRDLFFRLKGKVPGWGLDAAELLAEKLV
jgi:sulfide:quinone oxidoreductase